MKLAIKRNKILSFLKRGGLMTKQKSLRSFGLINLGETIRKLRESYDIETIMVTSPKGERYGIYKLPKAEQIRLALREAG